MLDACNLGSGLAYQSQVLYEMFRYSWDPGLSGEVDTSKVRREHYQDTTLFTIPEGLLGQASFGHLVGY